MKIGVGYSNTSEARRDPIFSEVVQNTLKLRVNLWSQSVKPFQNGGHFKLPRINFTVPGVTVN